MSGTTCTVVFVNATRDQYVVAHAGDSRAICIKYAQGEIKAVDLTEDHKPDLPKEKARIQQGGGRVIFDGHYNYRVFAPKKPYPGLCMSRALGDTIAHREAGVTETPDVKVCKVDPNEDLALLIASDGVWEFLKSQTVAEMVGNDYEFGRYKLCCSEIVDKVVKRSWDLWMKDSGGQMSDDITAILVLLGKELK